MNKNIDKAATYDELVRQGDILLREISKLKSAYPVNVPAEIQKQINENHAKVKQLEQRLLGLY